MAAAQGSPTAPARQSSVFRLEGEAHALADRLPELVLDALHVPVESQMLVMSKTGVQGLYTGPANPRAARALELGCR